MRFGKARSFFAYLHAIIGLWMLGNGFHHFGRGSRAVGDNMRTRATVQFKDDTTYFRLMLSAPAARPSEDSPTCIAWAILRIAIRPDEHNRFTVDMGTSAGIPAAIAAARDM